MRECKECELHDGKKCRWLGLEPTDGPCEKFRLNRKDYSDVNRLYRGMISSINVSPATGKALISLKNGGGVSVDSPEDAIKELERIKNGK